MLSILRSVVAIFAGPAIGYLVDRWVVFPAILAGAAHLPPGGFDAHRTAYGAGMIVLELGSVVLATALFIGLVAPRRAGLHALIAGVLWALGSLAMGATGIVSTPTRVLAFAVQTAIVVYVAAWIERRSTRARIGRSVSPRS